MPQIKAIKIKSDDLPAQKDHENSPLYRQEKFIYYYKNSNNAKNKEIYSNFFSDFSIYLIKLASSSLKKWATVAHDRGVLLLGHQINSQSIGLVDRVVVTSGKVTSIVIDASSVGFEVERDSLSIDHIDKAVYTSYHAMIRAAVNEQFLKLRRDSDVSNSLVEWYHMLFLRAFSLPTLSDLEFAKFDFVICYFIYRFILLENHIISFANAKSYIESKYKDDAKDAYSDAQLSESLFKSSTNIRDIVKAFKMLDITPEDTMRQIQSILKKIGTSGFITITSSADYVISGIIMSMYYKGYSDLLLSSQLQMKLERSIDKYLNLLKFGNAVK